MLIKTDLNQICKCYDNLLIVIISNISIGPFMHGMKFQKVTPTLHLSTILKIYYCGTENILNGNALFSYIKKQLIIYISELYIILIYYY